jgi:hypothetical protein
MIRDPSDGSVREPQKPARCANCDGYGWVCENHPDVPWEGVAGYGCDCGAGMPCSCNTASPPWDFKSDFVDEAGPILDTTTSGLPTGSSKPENIARLEKSREWLENYRAKKERKNDEPEID